MGIPTLVRRSLHNDSAPGPLICVANHPANDQFAGWSVLWSFHRSLSTFNVNKQLNVAIIIVIRRYSTHTTDHWMISLINYFPLLPRWTKHNMIYRHMRVVGWYLTDWCLNTVALLREIYLDQWWPGSLKHVYVAMIFQYVVIIANAIFRWFVYLKNNLTHVMKRESVQSQMIMC